AEIERSAAIDFGAPPWTPPAPPPPSALPATAEVVVVGAGVTGLSAALAAAEAGRDVTVVERRFGSGATSRSGGGVLGGTPVGPRDGFEECDVALRRWIERVGAKCGVFW